ncbi:hypothetical protein SAMN05216215_10457 [Saccharopolyspora shandongensis]|uniref:Uncharacterized protein n=1 Tax=Saccharopolyspora shandongensis TaxID=418495 RepID=A0A1H3Q0B6_9PSEU|nr:hypothetical protein [Saccharopolyspora shandongensis]SDZ06962.1 hypothetical protein SAMN05216215_10457 [Saccharopolyspora shandongensis]
MLAGGDAVEDFDGIAAGEQVAEHEQAFEKVAAEPVDFLHGEHVPGPHVVDRRGQCWTVYEEEHRNENQR